MITSFKDNQVVLQPQGELNLQSGKALRQVLCTLSAQAHSCWVIDLTYVDLINSSGLAALLNGLNLAQEQRCRLLLLNPNPTVKLVFEITRLDELFDVVESLDALNHIDSRDGQHEFAADLDRAGEIAQAA